MNRFRSDIITEDFLNKVLSNCHENAKNIELVHFSSEPGTSKGDNFIGELASVKVVANVLKHGESQPKEFNHHWMVKMMKPDDGMGPPELGRLLGAFDREMKIYKDILPVLQKISPITSCPMFYVDDTLNKEALVLEHMRQHGWGDAHEKKKGLNLDYVNLVVDWFADFHGLSHVMMESYPGGKKAYVQDHPWVIPTSVNPPSPLEKFSRKFMEEQKRIYFELAEIVEDGDSSKGYVNFLKDLDNNGIWVDDLRKAMQNPREPFSTFNHLDPWFNNMLFHHDENEKPSKVLLLDFQVAGYTHPGNDLALFMMTSTLPSFREKHLDEILRRYHQKLHQVIKDGGFELQYSLEDLKEDYRVGLAIGVAFCLFVLPMVLAEADESDEFFGVDFNDPNEAKKFQANRMKSIHKMIQSDPDFRSRIAGIFDDMIRANIVNIV